MKISTLPILLILLLTQVDSERIPNSVNDDIIVKDNDNQTVLQKHVSFFDRNKDGIIYPSEIFQGFRAIGSNIFLSSIAAIFINQGLSQKTRPGKSLSLLFPIEIENIKFGKHGSDTGVFDNEGNFVELKFEEIFDKYAVTQKDALIEEEIVAMLNANKQPKDFAGSFAANVEWKILYMLCKDKNGLLQKQTVRGLYDGTLFYEMEKNAK